MAEINLTQVLVFNVRREMQLRGWSQTQLAAQAGIAQQRVSSLLMGQYASKLSTVERIAKAFGVSPYALLAPPPDGTGEIFSADQLAAT